MTKAAILSALALSLPAFAAQEGAPLRASLIGYQEVPSVSSKADGEFEARIAADGQSFDYTLAWEGLQADVLMAHIHFAQKGVTGPIVVWLYPSGPPAQLIPHHRDRESAFASFQPQPYQSAYCIGATSQRQRLIHRHS